MSNSDVPEGFTLALALVDAVPVLLFGAAAVAFGAKLSSPLFTLGAVLALLGGSGKVAWKLIIAVAHKNIPWLGRQMRATMPAGFLLMIVGAAMYGGKALALMTSLARIPSLPLVLVWIACMCAMGYFAGHRDQTSARDNWIEQLTNACGQAALLLAVLLTG
jgi:hypothetical protein